eukprot:scaffold4747_cov99-Isochrysis_galbana.AAC.1
MLAGGWWWRWGSPGTVAHTFRHGLVSRLARVGRQLLLEFRNGVATEADSLEGVEQRRLPQHALDRARAA